MAPYEQVNVTTCKGKKRLTLSLRFIFYFSGFVNGLWLVTLMY